MESFSRPPPRGTSDCADPEASWGHRKNNLLRSENELFFGYYLSAAIMMGEENGPAVPELTRRATLSSCRHNPVHAFAPLLTAMPGQGFSLRPPRPSRLGHPAARRRRPARPGPPPPMTAGPRAPTTAPSSPTATCTAPAHRARCWNCGRSPATPAPATSPRTTLWRSCRGGSCAVLPAAARVAAIVGCDSGGAGSTTTRWGIGSRLTAWLLPRWPWPVGIAMMLAKRIAWSIRLQYYLAR